MGRFDIRTRSGLLSTIVQGQTASPSDGDAQAFIFRVEAAGGTLTTTEKNAVNTLVIRLKAANIWTKLLAVYPMVGASAAACAQNLRSNSFTGAFSSGWTFASTGATPNGTSAFMETSFNPRTSTTGFSQHMAMYSRTQNSSVSGMQMGCTPAGAEMNLYQYYASSGIKGSTFYIYPATAVTSSNSTTTGFQISSKTSSTSLKLYFNGSLLDTNTTTETLTRPDRTIYLGASKGEQGAFLFRPHEHAFDSLGDGLTDTEASNYYNIVQEFQTLLGRQIGAPGVSDADASAFIQRVYTAGGTLTTAEQNAVNQLTIDLKAASIWTGMKAIYPMVGSSAAACAQNLRTGSYTGTFSGGVIYAATGVTGNGTTGYMNTGLTANTVLTPANHHISYYSRNNPTPGTSVEIGAEEASSGYQGPFMRTRLTGFGDTDSFNYYVGNDNTLTAVKSTNLDSRGHFIGNILSSTNRKTYKNGSISGTLTSSLSNTLTPGNIYVLAANDAPSTPRFYSTKECAFASIGDGLTDTQAVYFNNAVETFQTSLSRNVGAIIPTVSDADAQDFVARVYGAGGTLSATELNAVNQLVISMKVAGVWTAMKAVYPMVGASSAACAQNLKSSSFTGAFTSGWTFASTGATPNGTSTYMDTGFNTSTNLVKTSVHLSFYTSTNSAGNHYEIANSTNLGLTVDNTNIQPRYSANIAYFGVADNGTYSLNTSSTDSRGFWCGTRVVNNQYLLKNGIQLVTGAAGSGNLANNNLYIGAANAGGTAQLFSNKQCSFASIGDGLTNTQVLDFYNAVQAFQTTLSRNV